MAIKLGKQNFVTPAPRAMDSFALQQRIWPIAAKLISALSVIEGKSLLEVEIEKILGPLARVFSEMPPGELEAVTRILLKNTTFDGLPLFNDKTGENAFDNLMQGRTVDTWKLLWDAFKVWYPDFLAHAATLLVKKDAAASGSEASTTSTTPGPASA